MTDSWLVIAAA
jgi:threonine dehydratase